MFYNIDNTYYAYNEIDDPDEKHEDKPGIKKKKNAAGLMFSSLYYILSSLAILYQLLTKLWIDYV